MIPSEIFINEICSFLEENGIACSVAEAAGVSVIRTSSQLSIVPLEVRAAGPAEASACRIAAETALRAEASACRIAAETALRDEASACSAVAEAVLQADTGNRRRAIVVASDRWRSEGDCIRKRLLAHAGRFRHIFARNCVVKKIRNDEAAEFMNLYHSYGTAVSRYRYGLFLKKDGTMVAAATFSNGRLMTHGGKTFRSYQWIRYASLPDVRVTGGMGKILKHFVREITSSETALRDTGLTDYAGCDIMSYADLEWSDGDVYAKLGFIPEGAKSPVMYHVDPVSWRRTPVSREENGKKSDAGALWFENFGSIKYRLIIYRDSGNI